jgi:hypothetical protein
MRNLLLASISLILGSFNIYSQQFTESALAMGVDHKHIDINQMGGGVAVFDLNNDGYDDLYLTGGSSDDKLFLNNQDETFTDISASSGISLMAGIHTVGVTTGDIDNDGDRDIFVTTFRNDTNRLLLNNGDNTFTDISVSAGITAMDWSTSATMGDFDDNGYLDIYVANYTTYGTQPFYSSLSGGIRNTLYMNDGSLNFTDVSTSSATDNIGTSLAVAFTNFDDDTDVDLFVGNDFGYNYGANTFYQNNASLGTFSDVGTSTFTDYEIDAMGIAIGDFDEDLDLDYYVSNMMENLLHVRDSALTFDESALEALVQADTLISWGTFFFDYDNDTYLDLFVANGGVMMMADPEPNVLFKNMENGTFQDLAMLQGVDSVKRSRGAAYGDFNNDGKLDFVVANVGPNEATTSGTSIYMSNVPSSNHWIAFELEGYYANRDAFGTQVILNTGGRSFIREIGGGSSYLSQNSSRVYFGLGDLESIANVMIIWPNGHEEYVGGFAVDTLYQLSESPVGLDENLNDHSIKVYPNPTQHSITVRQEEKEDLIFVVLDQFGRSVYTSTGTELETTLDLSSISNGVYFLEIRSSTSTIVEKIVKR